MWDSHARLRDGTGKPCGIILKQEDACCIVQIMRSRGHGKWNASCRQKNISSAEAQIYAFRCIPLSTTILKASALHEERYQNSSKDFAEMVLALLLDL